jgi:photosystem II stability/assembly factor-like uncharacterized protein
MQALRDASFASAAGLREFICDMLVRMRAVLLLVTLSVTSQVVPAQAQWTIQKPATTADLRGIDNVGKGIAWASGTDGTVLRTEDGGYLWQHCTTPPGAEHLDFRGIQAFDANTAIVMSSGKGDLSRLYKTTDGCQTWKLVFTNPEKDGFWDGLKFVDSKFGVLFGDPVGGVFTVLLTFDGGLTWTHDKRPAPAEINGEGAFAASNSSLLVPAVGRRSFCTGGAGAARIIQFYSGAGISDVIDSTVTGDPTTGWQTILRADKLATIIPETDSAGCFSLAASPSGTIVAVGGDYKMPEKREFTAWTSARQSTKRRDNGDWLSALTPPHGYRSAVGYDAPIKTWITVGPNGTDVSTDDGRNWRALRPTPGEEPDADQHWNALSLPFVVGPHGRIGTLNPDALKH